MGRYNHPGREDEKAFCEQHNRVVPGLILAVGLRVLCLSFAVYALLCLCLGDEQHPKMAANKRRATKTRQKMLITTNPPRAQSLVVISLFRSSRTEDASCTDDMLASTLLEVDKNNIRCWCILSML